MKDDNIKGPLVYTLAFFAAIIIYGIIAIRATAKMAPWTDNEFLVLLPLAILCGLGCATSNVLWERLKEKKKKERDGKK